MATSAPRISRRVTLGRSLLWLALGGAALLALGWLGPGQRLAANLAHLSLVHSRLLGSRSLAPWIRSALTPAADTPRALYWLAQLSEQQGDATAALAHLEQAVSLPGSDATLYFELGRKYLARRERAAALAAFAKAPNSEFYFLARGYQAVKQVGWLAAVDDIRLAAEIRPESALAQEAWGQAQVYGLGRFTDGIASYRTAVALGRDLPYVWIEIAQAQQMAGQDAAALETLDRLKDMDARDPLAHSIRGTIYLGQKRFGEAAHELQLAMAMAPDNPWFLTDYGRVLCELERAEDARAAWRRALELAPGFGPAAYAHCP